MVKPKEGKAKVCRIEQEIDECQGGGNMLFTGQALHSISLSTPPVWTDYSTQAHPAPYAQVEGARCTGMG